MDCDIPTPSVLAVLRLTVSCIWWVPEPEDWRASCQDTGRNGGEKPVMADSGRRLAMRDDWKIRVGAVPFPRRWRGSARSFGRNNSHRVRSAIRPPVVPMVRGKTRESSSGDASRMVATSKSLLPSDKMQRGAFRLLPMPISSLRNSSHIGRPSSVHLPRLLPSGERT